MATNRDAFRRWTLALVRCAIGVVVCIAYVDRAVAEFLETNVRHTELWAWLDRALRPLDLVIVAALIFLFGCGIWVLCGRQLGGWTEMPLLCAWSTMWAVVATVVGKRIFGRAWPDPTYVHDHLYGFHFLRGSPHWDSFPSGTATISTAIISVLWVLSPRRRVVSLLIVALLSVAIVITNYHWISDVIAGAFMGASIGWFTVQLRDSRSRPIG